MILEVRNRTTRSGHRVRWPRGTNDACPTGLGGEVPVFHLHKGLVCQAAESDTSVGSTRCLSQPAKVWGHMTITVWNLRASSSSAPGLPPRPVVYAPVVQVPPTPTPPSQETKEPELQSITAQLLRTELCRRVWMLARLNCSMGSS